MNASTVDLAEQPLPHLTNLWPRGSLSEAAAVGRETRGQGGILDEPHDRVAHRVDVARRHDQAGLAVDEQVPNAAGIG